MSQISDRKVVCLCGSTRFTDKMLVKQWELMKQRILAIGWYALPQSYIENLPNFDGDYGHVSDKEGNKELADEMHKRKIDLADEVLILNYGGYIGTSTRSEIEYARSIGKMRRNYH